MPEFNRRVLDLSSELAGIPSLEPGDLCVVFGNEGKWWNWLLARANRSHASVSVLTIREAQVKSWQHIDWWIDARRNECWQHSEGPNPTFAFVELPPSAQAKNQKNDFYLRDAPYSQRLISVPSVVLLCAEHWIEVMKDRRGNTPRILGNDGGDLVQNGK